MIGQTSYKTLFKWSLVFNFVLAITIMVGAIALSNTASNVQENTNQRQISAAQTRFLLCSRNTDINAPEKIDGVKFVCSGYQTLKQSLETQKHLGQ